MKYIEKDIAKAPAVYLKEIKEKQLDAESLGLGAHAEQPDNRKLFKRMSHVHSSKILKRSLLREQGYCCCYCNEHIDDGTWEHLLPLSDNRYRPLIFDYTNLYISCYGESDRPSGTDRKIYPIHCDKAKLEQDLPITPKDKNCESKFVYDSLGNVRGTDKPSQDTIDILKLNCILLIKKRKAAILPWIFKIDAGRPTHLLSKDELENNFCKILQKNSDGQYISFYHVIAMVIYDLIK